MSRKHDTIIFPFVWLVVLIILLTVLGGCEISIDTRSTAQDTTLVAQPDGTVVDPPAIQYLTYPALGDVPVGGQSFGEPGYYRVP